MERHVKDILGQNRQLLRNSVREATDSITTYDVNDMRAVLQSQKIALEDALTKNVLLVAENSELRMHLSFMPSSIATMWNNFRQKITSCIATNDANRRSLSQRLITSSAMRSAWKMHLWQTGTYNSPFAMRSTLRLEKPVLRWIEFLH